VDLFSVAGANIWNSLPIDITTSASSLEVFKQRLKMHLTSVNLHMIRPITLTVCWYNCHYSTNPVGCSASPQKVHNKSNKWSLVYLQHPKALVSKVSHARMISCGVTRWTSVGNSPPSPSWANSSLCWHFDSYGTPWDCYNLLRSPALAYRGSVETIILLRSVSFHLFFLRPRKPTFPKLSQNAAQDKATTRLGIYTLIDNI